MVKMSAKIVHFPHSTPPVQPVGHFLRLGESGYRKLANLKASGFLPAQHVVVDASKLHHQKELLADLRASGVEIVLDTKSAELGAPHKCSGHAKQAPWGALAEGNPLGPSWYQPNHRSDLLGHIARFAVSDQVDAVLAPTHFLGDPSFAQWFSVDRRSCELLRRALDREGGASIAIDYPLILPHTFLNDHARREEFCAGLAGLPFENLWIRASGFGLDAAPLTTRRFIVAMTTLHGLGKPIVADYLGGIVGLAALAFGAVSGLANGVGERERFDARTWHKPPTKIESGRGGRRTRILIPTVHRSVTVPELEVLAGARGGRRLLACSDRCCPHGLPDMINDPRRHAVYQTDAQIVDLSAVPDLRREQHFLDGPMSDADRRARQLKDLKASPDQASRRGVDIGRLMKRLADHSKQTEKMLQTLEDLHESRGNSASRSHSIRVRQPAESAALQTES
jgi:hypothetical protein